MITGDEHAAIIAMPDGRHAQLEGGAAALRAARRTASHVVIMADGGERMLVPASSITQLGDGSYRFEGKGVSRQPLEATGPPTGAAMESSADSVTTLPVMEEEISVSKQERVTGIVRLSKTIREEEAIVDEPIMVHRVEVERVAVNRAIDKIPSPRQEGDTLILSVVEEVLVVEKRLVLKEEVRVRRIEEEIHKPERITLRREEVHVERTDPAGEK